MDFDQKRVLEILRRDPSRNPEGFLSEHDLALAFFGGRLITGEARKRARSKLMSKVNGLVKCGWVERRRDRHNQRHYRARSLLDVIAEAAQ